MESGEQEVLTPLLWLPTIVPPRVPNTLKEFSTAVNAEDIDFVRGLCATDRRGLFAYASRNLFKIESLFSIVYVGPNDVPGSRDLSREPDELRENCEGLERENSDVVKELAELRENANVVNSL